MLGFLHLREEGVGEEVFTPRRGLIGSQPDADRNPNVGRGRDHQVPKLLVEGTEEFKTALDIGATEGDTLICEEAPVRFGCDRGWRTIGVKIFYK